MLGWRRARLVRKNAHRTVSRYQGGKINIMATGRAVLLLVCTAWLSACTKNSTRLIVHISTNLDASAFDRYEVEVSRPMRPPAARSFTRAEVDPEGSFVVVPSDNSLAGPITIKVNGIKDQDTVVSATGLVDAFEANKELHVSLCLSGLCRDNPRACAELTLGTSAEAPDLVCLMPPPKPDAGPPDLGLPDQGPPDLGEDLGAPDLGPPDLGPLDLGAPDLGEPDLGAPDLGPRDLGPEEDLGPPDMGADPDLGPVDTGIPADWWDVAWKRRTQITFANQQRGRLDDFPVLVILDPSRIDYAAAHPSGDDLRFIDGPSVLSHEIEQWTSGGTSYVWVRIPSIDGGSNTDSVQMYYGNLSPPPPPNPTETWSGEYTGVWHFNGSDTASTFLTGDVTRNGVVFESTHIAAGLRFDGVNDHGLLPVGLINSTVGSVCLWYAYTEPMMQDDNAMLFYATDSTSMNANGYGSEPELHINLTFPDRDVIFNISNGELDSLVNSIQNIVVNEIWTHVCATWDAQATVPALTLYHNGTSGVGCHSNGNCAGVHVTQPLFSAGAFIRLGRPNDNERYFSGRMDEVQIRSDVLSPDWISAQYESTRPGSTFLTFGPAIDISGP